MKDNYISVTVLTGYIKNILSSEEMLQNIQLVGEVSGIRCSGLHAYFTLKDQNAQIDCCCFHYSRTYLPKNGESVVLTGSVDFYQKGGKMSFVARSIQPLGMGLLALQLEQLKAKLAGAGYFDQSHKVPVPKYPDRVCVITAKTGAVIRDIVSTVRKKNNILDIDVIDVKVQGVDSASSIIKALDLADSLGYDAIIIARGGGSMEDLMPFNNEQLVYKIYETVTPVISAVGHETDFTLCDFVSDMRVPTPTAAGELVGYDVEGLKASIIAGMNRCKSSLNTRLELYASRLSDSVRKLSSGNAIAYEQNRAKLVKLSDRMAHAVDGKLTMGEHMVKQMMARLDGNNPAKILSQGYARVYDSVGHNADISSIAIGDSITVLMHGGRVNATASEIILDKNEVNNG